MACGILLGGASAPVSLLALTYQFLATILLVIGLFQLRRFGRSPPRALVWASIAPVALALVQVAPLPFQLWSQLPGRQAAHAYLSAGGIKSGPLAVSFDPNSTLAALASLTPAFAMIALLMGTPKIPIRLLFSAIIGLAVVSWVVGVLQFFGSASSPLYIHSFTNWGLAVGFFANANHLATFLLIGLPIIAALAAERVWREELAGGYALCILGAYSAMAAAGISLASSVAGVVLLIPVILGSLLLLPLPARMRLLAAVPPLVCAGAAVALSAGTLRTSFEDSASRPEIWRTTLSGIETYWPTGTGMGSFVAVYPSFENGTSVASRYVNHAHNDYLEWVFESGLPGLMLICAGIGWWTWRCFLVWRRGTPAQRLWQRASSVAMGAILAHSLVDYPLRTPAILVLFVLFAWVLADEPERRTAKGIRA